MEKIILVLTIILLFLTGCSEDVEPITFENELNKANELIDTLQNEITEKNNQLSIFDENYKQAQKFIEELEENNFILEMYIGDQAWRYEEQINLYIAMIEEYERLYVNNDYFDNVYYTELITPKSVDTESLEMTAELSDGSIKPFIIDRHCKIVGAGTETSVYIDLEKGIDFLTSYIEFDYTNEIEILYSIDSKTKLMRIHRVKQ